MDEDRALALALIRLQDMGHAVPRRQLEECCGELSDLVDSPWELVATIHIDDEYLRLARREALIAIDQWMDRDRKWLSGRIALLGERFRWARGAFDRWEFFHDFDLSEQSLSDCDAESIELLGPEMIEPALGISPKEAMRVLQVMFETAPDAWALREVGFELARRWETLRDCPKAHELREQFIADTDRRGMYALFEGMLRHGGVASLELWDPIVTKLTEMSRHLDEDGNRRQVALCFDALLWRRAPMYPQTDRMLLELLLEAAERDELLWAACAAAAAYHWDGARHLVELELPNPIEGLGKVSEAAAREMAWIVEWHFVHQSRNRAIASRRYYRSTRPVSPSSSQARLLSRKPLERVLPVEVAAGVVRVITQLARFPATAGWALHMAMNVHATSGDFEIPNLGALFSKVDVEDPGLIWGAITYRPQWGLGEHLRSKLSSEAGRNAIQEALAGDLELDGTTIAAPRFITTLDPWQEVRRRLQMDADILGDLGLPEDDPWKLVEVARGARDQVIERGADEEVVDDLIERLAAGDTRLIDHVHSNDERFAERGRKGARDVPENLEDYVISLLLFAAQIAPVRKDPE